MSKDEPQILERKYTFMRANYVNAVEALATATAQLEMTLAENNELKQQIVELTKEVTDGVE